MLENGEHETVPLKGVAKRKYARSYYLKNKKAILAKTRAYILAHPEVYQRSHKNRLFREHDTSSAEYETQLKRQGGRCAICGRKDTRSLSIDHDHSHCPGEQSCRLCNRGLLCNDCNKKLSVVEDRVFLRKAKKYLKKWRKRS